MPKEEAKRLLQSQIEYITAEIFRREAEVEPLNQELDALHRRVDELRRDIAGLS